jgi:formyltetrahydrofolate deformylase
MGSYRLLIDTQDEKGLVYKISNILYANNINIEQNSEFVDKNTNKFYMRSVIEGDFDKQHLLSKLQDIFTDEAKIVLKEDKKKDIVLLVTKEAHCLGDILIKHYSEELKANIKAVISNHDTLKPLVEKFNIDYHCVDSSDIDRKLHEKKIKQIIDSYNPEIIVLAKYMRILTQDFVSHYSQKILNIHHSFLPAFIGANPYKQAHTRGVKIIGATAHFVTNDLDEGPIISQDIVRVDHSYSWQDMQKQGKEVEKVVLSNALNLLLDDRVFVHQNKTIIL